jgi:hypothetical protein
MYLVIVGLNVVTKGPTLSGRKRVEAHYFGAKITTHSTKNHN